MSNLIDGPSSTSTGAVPQSIQTGALNAVNDDGISISDLWRTLLRRRKLVVTTAGTVFALSLINFVHQRINNPVFAGSFKLLISDPLSQERTDASSSTARFELLA